MAGADYKSCDKCGCKTFYDCDLNYEYANEDDPERVRGQHYRLGQLGDWAVLCLECSKSFRCVIEKIPEAEEVTA